MIEVEDNPLPPSPKGEPVLNGMYYERSTDKFVSFVLGRRFYEEPAKGCTHLKEWQNRIKKERSI
ncbi:hypothetical protein EJP82_01065 [Paenibacillus anaericanus]|uniref:Uncharacterized protein n=1 Tax=Paenibacillus anaericanus TaxID=170367 RepID=A0A3S1BSX6_9BACL|nr:hypothetical protein EJP82_01065 [Paenibacillus anaericanus]